MSPPPSSRPHPAASIPKPALPLAAALTAALATVLLAAPARADDRRYAVLIGANLGDAGEGRLRYAEADAERLAQTLRTIGDFAPDRILVLTGVGADEVRQSLIRLNARLREEARPALLFVYYSGHADEESLHLAGTRLATAELRGLVTGSAAGSRVLVLDACRSGAVTRIKGGRSEPPFSVMGDLAERVALPTGVAILTSSADGEDSQESDQLRASFFTYYFNSGLIGSADVNGDDRVTLGEAFTFASEQTLVATMGTVAGPQHATYRFDLGGRQDLVLTRPRSTPNRVGALAIAEPGRYMIRRLQPGSGEPVPVAELVARDRGAKIALPPGAYQVTVRGLDSLYEGSCEVTSGQVAHISLAQMERLSYARMVRKGGARASVNSLVATAGLQGPFGGFDSGPAGVLAWRQDRARLSWEARLGLAQTTATNSSIDFENRLFSGTLAAAWAWDLHLATVSAGIEGGLLAVRQTFSSLTLPPQLRGLVQSPGASWSLGAILAPLLQVDLPLRVGGHVRLEAAAPVYLMQVERSFDQEVRLQTLGTLRLLAGAGAYF